ncbi:hypothetical protein QBC44DRAFT_374920 [Cladorrhinum sp. PSN332]|nr:hypothetical protein QBC44DRAFT_374920 [Cladorrhinum sp. PSN332]
MALAFYSDGPNLIRTHLATHGYDNDFGCIGAKEVVTQYEDYMRGYEEDFNPYAVGCITERDKDPGQTGKSDTWKQDHWDDQYWHCRAGEEVSIADPGEVNGLDQYIRNLMIASGYFQLPEPPALDLGHQVQQDPFRKLPVEILTEIAWHLENMEDLVNLGKTSWYANLFLRGASNIFWKDMMILQTEWFPELRDCVIRHRDLSKVNMKGAYLWTNTNTRAARNTQRREGLIGIANRRRIFKVCCDLVARCQRKRLAEKLARGDEPPTGFESSLRPRPQHFYAHHH